MTIIYAGISVELREVLLSQKPPSMLKASPKATVPILQLPDGRVIDESIDVMHWALDHNDTDEWRVAVLENESASLVEQNDFEFKSDLDQYKYSDRYPEHSQTHYRRQGEKFLLALEKRLEKQRFLLADELKFVDVAIFPFVRQFAFVDKRWFDQAPYPNLRKWLQSFLDSILFTGAMNKYPTWQDSDASILIN
jgi:glutathione S-transferase